MKKSIKTIQTYAVGFACISWISLSPLFAGVAATDLKNPITNQDLPSAAPVIVDKPSWKPGDPIAFANGKVVFDVQERIRMEVRNNTFDFNDSQNHVTDDTFLLNRFRLGVKVTPSDFVSIYAQGQDTREAFSKRPNVPFQFGSEGDDTFDLFQGYVDLGNKEKFPVTARLGRQVLSYGDERLIGGFDWNNFSRSFDAAKVSYTIDTQTKSWVDFFIGNVVTQEGYDRTDRHNFEFNESNNKDLFTGIYASTRAIDFQETQLYVLYRDKTGHNPEYNSTGGPTALSPVNTPYDGDQNIWTMGTRWASTSPGRLKGFDYTFEGVYQTGVVSEASSPTGVNIIDKQGLKQEAYAAHADIGYNMELAPWTPRVGLEYNYASGDGDAKDGKSGTFQNLFPTNHKFFGIEDLFAWKNMQNAGISLSAKPNTKIKLRMDYRLYWLDNTADAWYRANGVSQVRATNSAANQADSFAGSEVDLVASYAYSKSLTFSMGYSHFFAADYLKQTESTNNPQTKPIVPAGDDSNFFYFQTEVKL